MLYHPLAPGQGPATPDSAINTHAAACLDARALGHSVVLHMQHRCVAKQACKWKAQLGGTYRDQPEETWNLIDLSQDDVV